MQHVRNQHTVPQFLLKNFSNKNGTHIWSFDKEAINKHWSTEKNRAIKNVPTREYFYDKVKGQKANSFEYKLHELETISEPALTELLQTQDLNTLNKYSKDVIANFISYQMLRTMGGYQNAQRFQNDFYEPIENLIGGKINRNSKKLWLNMLGRADEFKFHLLNKTWILATSNERFYISDNPVAFQNITNIREGRGNGLNTPGTEIYLPLSSSLVLCVFCTEAVPRQIPNIRCNLGNIENLNSLQVIHSDRFIFSKDGDFKLVNQMIKENAL